MMTLLFFLARANPIKKRITTKIKAPNSVSFIKIYFDECKEEIIRLWLQYLIFRISDMILDVMGRGDVHGGRWQALTGTLSSIG